MLTTKGRRPRDPDAARLCDLRAAGGRRHPGMRGSRLGEGPGRPACARPRLRDREAGSGISPDDALAEVRDVLESIGDTCPECPPYAE